MLHRKSLLFSASMAAALAVAPAANAAVVVLDFAGVANPNNTADVDDFYNGGTSSDGNSGPNYGVTFSDNALAINSYNGCCEPDAEPGVLFFLDGPAVFINYDTGFDTGFSFYYSSNTADGMVSVFDGVNGTGNVLASFSLANNFSDSCAYCVWDPIGVSFGGIAKSIGFAGAANFIAFDDITFGSADPGVPGVPEPATWAMMIGGFGLAGATMRMRRRTTVTA